MMTFVYAQEANGGIGYQNQLPWHLPDDLKFFKEVTMGHTLLMGRKTFDSMNRRLLPGRRTIVMTRDKEYAAEISGLIRIHDYQSVLEIAQNQELMVIGGAEIFNMFWEDVTQIIRTRIFHEYPCDTYMPDIDPYKFECVNIDQRQNGEIHYQFEWWQRKNGAM